MTCLCIVLNAEVIYINKIRAWLPAVSMCSNSLVEGKLLHRQCLFWNGRRTDMGLVEIEHVGECETKSVFQKCHDDEATCLKLFNSDDDDILGTGTTIDDFQMV